MPYAKRTRKSPAKRTYSRTRNVSRYGRKRTTRSGSRSTRAVSRPQTIRIELVHKADNPVAALPIPPSVTAPAKRKAPL